VIATVAAWTVIVVVYLVGFAVTTRVTYRRAPKPWRFEARMDAVTLGVIWPLTLLGLPFVVILKWALKEPPVPVDRKIADLERDVFGEGSKILRRPGIEDPRFGPKQGPW
jgi:hypothetical protein